jgi:aminoglycoside 3-N-acetyltransferase
MKQMLNFEDLVSEFRRIGLTDGDTVMVHSSYKSFGGIDGGPQTVLDALIDVIGNEGTLIMPRFNFDFSSLGTIWDVNSTPSHMGIISEFARKDPRSRKVFHPIYPFSIIGKHADDLVKHRYKGGYSKDSIFHQLCVLDAKIIQIDKVYKGTTLIHHVEEMLQVDYKYFKDFKGTVIDETGKKYDDTFNLYVRDWEKGYVTDVLPIGKILEREGVMKVYKIGDATIWYMKAKDVYQCTMNAIKKNPHVLCKIIPPTKENEFLIKNYSEGLKSDKSLFGRELSKNEINKN